jgi:SAM-dependent methyltransferase
MTWADHVTAWSSPPVDDAGYQSAQMLAALPDTDLLQVIVEMRRRRYQGWRNEGGAWRDRMGHHELVGHDVLDYGCGTGAEAIDLARHNRVWLADITPDNIELARRVMDLFGAPCQGGYLIGEHPPYIEPDRLFDVIYAAGVLHHCRHPHAVLTRWWELLRPGGQARVLLYAAGLWREAVGGEPPREVETHPAFTRFVRHADGVGDYADWYDRDRLACRADGLFAVERCGELGGGRLLAATLRRIDGPHGTVA